MKDLTAIKLINWHHFKNVKVACRGSLLFTGDNGSGKSTIIDAIQYVLVADQRHLRLNASAHNETRRTIKDYLRGKTGSDSGRPYLRTGDSTTYVVLEFWDHHKKQHFLLGVAADVYAGEAGNFDARFFKWENQRLDDRLFLDGKRPRGSKEFGVWKKQYPGLNVYSTIEAYQNDLLQKIGGLRDRFFSLLVKAMAFKPITDIRDFVYSYVLEEKELKIETMRENFENYRRYANLVNETKEKMTRLDVILAKHAELTKEWDRIYTQDLIIALARAEGAREAVASREAERLQAATELTGLEQAIQTQEQTETDLKRQHEELNRTLAANETFILEHSLKSKREDLKRQLNGWRRDYDAYLGMARAEALNLGQVLEINATLPETAAVLSETEAETLTAAGRTLVCLLNREAADLTGLTAVGEVLPAIADRAGQRLWEEGKRLKELDTELKQVRERLTNLNASRLTYDERVTALQKAIDRQLNGQGRPSRAQVLCELLRIPNEKWQDAVEGYLNTQRFDLLVQPEDFDQALQTYEQVKKQQQIYGVGLVNTGKILAYTNTDIRGSLAEEVATEDPYARGYVNRLLGGVVKCETEQELKRHKLAITPTCMTYRNHTARQINFEVYRNWYIGERALVRQKEQAESRQQELTVEITALTKLITALEQLKQLTAEKREVFRSLVDKETLVEILTVAERDLQDLEEQLATLDKSDYEELARRLTSLDIRLKTMEKDLREAYGRRGRLQEKITKLDEGMAVWQAGLEAADRELAAIIEGHPELETTGRERYARERRSRLSAVIEQNFASNRSTLVSKATRFGRELWQLEFEFNRDYHFGAAPSETAADEYVAYRRRLAESDLPAYEERIARAQADAEVEFKEHFVHRLKESIEGAEQEFRRLNDALKGISFGADTYQFKATPHPEFRKIYNLVMDPNLMEGGSLFDDVFREQHREALDELFAGIIDTPVERLQENVRRLTDYRNFLEYDIKITSNGEVSSFARVCREKSGGETQTPYYVAIIASFVQLYRLGTNRDCIRLVMFDEAFNRMDDSRIETSLQFIRKMGLQAIIAAPTEKCEYIAPWVETTQLVLRDGYEVWLEDYHQLIQDDTRDTRPEENIDEAPEAKAAAGQV